MSEKTRPSRSYNAPVRRARAAQTRRQIVDAAARVFVVHGYAGATIPAIAAEAGVAVETVYRSAGGKATLLADAVRAAVAGGAERAEVPVEQRPAVRRMIAEPDPVRQLEMYAATQPGIWQRVGPIMRVLDAAAVSDPSLNAVRDRLAAERLHGLRSGLAGMLARQGVLRPGLTVERAGDIVFALCGLPNYDALVTGCGWTPKEYQRWLAETLVDGVVAG